MRDCPICGDPMEYLGEALDDDGRLVLSHRCAFCREEFHERPQPPPGYRQEIRAAVRELRRRQRAGEPLPERGVA